jgi:hypothetical protein
MPKISIPELQERIGATPDGFWGPKSIAQCQKHLRSLIRKSGSDWPAPDQASLTKFYGKPGDESQLVSMPAPVPMYFEGRKVKTIRVHRKCEESLRRVLLAAFKIHPTIAAVISIYDGCYANRKMRGGSLPSLHARGAAIDFDAGHNGNLTPWPVVATMPIDLMEAFAREGWIAAGAFWGRDAMHFQATQ